MSTTYAEDLRRMAAERKPYDMFLHRVANVLDSLARVEDAAYRAHDCLGGEEQMRAILAEVCDPPKRDVANSAHSK